MTQGGPFLVATPWSHHAGERQAGSGLPEDQADYRDQYAQN